MIVYHPAHFLSDSLHSSRKYTAAHENDFTARGRPARATARTRKASLTEFVQMARLGPVLRLIISISALNKLGQRLGGLIGVNPVQIVFARRLLYLPDGNGGRSVPKGTMDETGSGPDDYDDGRRMHGGGR